MPVVTLHARIMQAKAGGSLVCHKSRLLLSPFSCSFCDQRVPLRRGGTIGLVGAGQFFSRASQKHLRIAWPQSTHKQKPQACLCCWLGHHPARNTVNRLGGVRRRPSSGLSCDYEPVDAAGGMFGAPAFEVVRPRCGCQYFSARRAPVPLVGPLTQYQRLRQAAEASNSGDSAYHKAPSCLTSSASDDRPCLAEGRVRERIGPWSFQQRAGALLFVHDAPVYAQHRQERSAWRTTSTFSTP
jgi:hypothetical protein